MDLSSPEESKTLQAPRFGAVSGRRRAGTGLFEGDSAFVMWVVGHFLVGVFMGRIPGLSTPVGLATVAGALFFVVMGSRIDIAIGAIAYLSCCDLIWRMTGASLPWEGGKYAIAGLSALLIVRTGRLGRSSLPFIYFALTILSVPIALSSTTLREVELVKSIRFMVAGPVALCICSIAMGGLSVNEAQLRRILVAFLGPAMLVNGLVFYSTITADEIQFVTESNFTTSGGFGPNQVSSTLSLGVLVAFFLFMGGSGSLLRDLVCLVLVCGGTLQTVLTFSRAGTYLIVVGCGAAMAIFFLRRASAIRAGVLFLIGGVFAALFALPFLLEFTSGMVVDRFTDTDASARTEILEKEMKILQLSPVFGVGTGAARYIASQNNIGLLSHTEYIRVLTELGFVGLTVFMFYLGRAWLVAATARSLLIRASLLGLIAWTSAYFLVNGFRLAVPAFLLSLGFLKCESWLDSVDGGRLAPSLGKSRAMGQVTPKENT